MKTVIDRFLCAAFSVVLGVISAAALAAPEKPTFDELAKPSTDVNMTPAYAKMLARKAYVWGWPMVNMYNRRATITQAPKPGLLGGILPVAPQGQIAMLSDYIDPAETFVTCPNQDVVYGLGFFDLDSQPIVIQVPDFGDRFWIYAFYDARTDQFGELGKPYGSQPGFYLVVGPNWEGETPDGINGVIHGTTSLANVIPRAFMDDTEADRAAIQSAVDQIVAYPLSEFDGSMKTMDWSELPSIPNPNADQGGGGETQWVVPEKFFDELGTVLDIVPPLPGEEALYAQLRWLLAVAETNPDIRQVIVDEAVAADKDVIKPFFRWEYNGKPAGNGWNRSVHNSEWGIDYYNRTGTAKSNMFDNRPSETQYFYTDYDSDGEQLDGSKTYAVTFAKGQEPPVNGFWSLTLYNDKHLFYPNDLHRYSLGTKNKNLKRNDDGSLTLYAGGTSPGADKESNWLPAPDGEFSLYIRAYWGKQGILEGSWQPPEVDVVE
ncbi:MULTISPECIES: DUF1254 domain-containing protein [Marinobacter]|uniref:DUF1254 domain-containing protein n=1 Tax=Marinobacter TaxID=2742 RepID=UPI000DADBC24|nr:MULTISPECIES: DUF1254 domain-containing protein [Marinobacter]